MCTLIVATRCAPDVPLFVVANRDESFGRLAAPPTLRISGSMRVLAPRDEQAGGTWLGLNEAGLFVAITNRFEVERRDHHRSRGELVWNALAREGVEGAVAYARALSPRDYGGFHLMMADAQGAAVVWSDGERLQHRRWAPGYYVISERSFGASPSMRLERLEARLHPLQALDAEVRDELVRWMAERDDEHPFEGTCVHLPEFDYGTRSSTVVALGEQARFEYCEGAPCDGEYRSYEALLRELRLA
ncbi:hypothetical protein DL240_08090 [Lujinxingia litoralis]|uniref:NRDE family protein n=1 Tax=Lujinxingia litoralis TaxID=2211119 RepID=A0A328C8B5_9DELT|nr:NRDE family protein [Lujinxingia litoralis]RAL22844.1 hypothetical protein DL240_08090 [Lujinxingia litoralis]